MPKASEIKKNAAVEYNGSVYFVKDIERSVPQGRAGGSIYRMRMYDVVTGSKLDESFKDGDMLQLADLIRRQVSLSYIDGEEYVFMDNEDFTMFSLNKESIEDEALFIAEDTQGLQVVVLNDSPVGVDLPSVVELVITDTAPAMKGSSATSRTKPATLTTGLVVQVPEHISIGDRIKINVDESKFTGRA
ncbi:MAG: elongation factor P-like protein YeiP [Alcanivorax sp.]|jgi:elongation factor P|nr:MAG: elongation factor P-like protein YeiP [Oceanobacter sp.]|tara:strand:+ start:1456 stop:2022 length:567 start_codon:yes stop_codon:yes gene_type:complete